MMMRRRELLKLLGAGAALAAVSPAALAQVSGDRYRNPRLSLSLLRPPGWHFLSVVDFGAMANEQVLDVAQDVQEFLRAPENLPIFMIGKYPASYDGYNPTISAIDEAGGPEDVSAFDCLSTAMDGYDFVFPGVVIEQAPAIIEMPGTASAARATWTYLYVHETGREWPVHVTTLIAFRRDRVHTIHFTRLAGAPGQVADELLIAERSLAYRDD